MVRVIEDEAAGTKINVNDGVVVIEGDSIDEVLSKDAKTAAIKYAMSKGINRPGVNFSSGAYFSGTKENPKKTWRCDWPVQGSI
jgi:hypothetical protein